MKKVTILICMMVALAGCSSDKAPGEYVAGAGKGRPLDMPPDLVMPKSDGQYAVPSGPRSSATYSEYAKSGAAAQAQSCSCAGTAAAPAVPKSSPAPIPHPMLQDRAGGGKSILLAEPFGRCWLRVSQAMDAVNIVPEDKDRSKRLFYLKGGGRLTVRGNRSGATPSCEIFAVSANGVSTDATKKVINAIYKALATQ